MNKIRIEKGDLIYKEGSKYPTWTVLETTEYDSYDEALKELISIRDKLLSENTPFFFKLFVDPKKERHYITDRHPGIWEGGDTFV